MSTNVYSGIIHNMQKAKTTQMSISWWVNKQNVVFLYHGILFYYKKEWSTNTRYNVSDPWKHNAEWKNTTKCHIVYNSIHIKIQNRQIYRD